MNGFLVGNSIHDDFKWKYLKVFPTYLQALRRCSAYEPRVDEQVGSVDKPVWPEASVNDARLLVDASAPISQLDDLAAEFNAARFKNPYFNYICESMHDG